MHGGDAEHEKREAEAILVEHGSALGLLVIYADTLATLIESS
jgi:hypothetical protein